MLLCLLPLATHCPKRIQTSTPITGFFSASPEAYVENLERKIKDKQISGIYWVGSFETWFEY